MDEQQNRTNEPTGRTCPGCGRHCPTEEPRCARGEIYAKTGALPEDTRGEYGGRDARGCRGERGCGGQRRGAPAMREQYGALSTEEKIFYNLHVLMHAGKPGGGQGGQGRILAILSERESIPQRELMEMLGVRSGTLSEVLGKLESAGYIRRAQSEDDRRGVDITITQSGREADKLKRQEWASGRALAFAALSEEERKTLLVLLEKAAAGAREDAESCETKACGGQNGRACRRGAGCGRGRGRNEEGGAHEGRPGCGRHRS